MFSSEPRSPKPPKRAVYGASYKTNQISGTKSRAIFRYKNPYDASEYRLQRFDPAFFTFPCVVRCANPLCIIFSLYSGRFAEISLIPNCPFDLKTSMIAVSRLSNSAPAFPESCLIVDVPEDWFLSFTSCLSFMSDMDAPPKPPDTRSALFRTTLSERVERCEAVRKLPSSSRDSTTISAL